MSAPEEKSPTGPKDRKKSKESRKSSEAKIEGAQEGNGRKGSDDKPEDVKDVEAKKDSEGGSKSAESEVRLIDGTGAVARNSEETQQSDDKFEGKKAKSKKSLPSEDAEDVVTFAEMVQQNFLRELMSKAEKKSKELKLNMLSQMNEVFRLFDIDRDGVIGETDLKFTFSSLGETNVSEEKIKNMLNECPSPIDFNAFVGLFESKEMEFDSEFDLVRAFAKWDNQKCGLILEEKIKNDLMKKGDRFSEKDADRALEEAPICGEEENQSIDYIELCTNICGLQNVRNSEMFQEKYSRSSFKK